LDDLSVFGSKSRKPSEMAEYYKNDQKHPKRSILMKTRQKA